MLRNWRVSSADLKIRLPICHCVNFKTNVMKVCLNLSRMNSWRTSASTVTKRTQKLCGQHCWPQLTLSLPRKVLFSKFQQQIGCWVTQLCYKRGTWRWDWGHYWNVWLDGHVKSFQRLQVCDRESRQLPKYGPGELNSAAVVELKYVLKLLSKI